MHQESMAANSASVLHIDRGLTIYQYVHLEKKVHAALKCATSLQVDLSHVVDIDSTGVQLLVMTKRWALQRKCSFDLHAPSAVAREYIALCGLEHYFNLLPEKAGTAS